MEEIRLYDREKDEQPSGLGKGWHRFRSKRPYKCAVCGCLSNEFVMLRGYPGFPPTLCCPGAEAKGHLHLLLWRKLDRAADQSYPKSFLDELEVEISELRRQFQQVPSNIQGDVEEWEESELKEVVGQ